MVEFCLLFSDETYRLHLGQSRYLNWKRKFKLWLGRDTDIEIQKENEVKKYEFLSIASHELKTPLTSIKAFNQLPHRVRKPENIDKFVKKFSEHILRIEFLLSTFIVQEKIVDYFRVRKRWIKK